MQFNTTSPRIIIQCSERVSTLIREESAVVTEVDAFRSEIAKWAVDRARGQAFDAKSSSEELLRWSRNYFSSVENRSSDQRWRRASAITKRAA
jgi:hypothetical protein